VEASESIGSGTKTGKRKLAVLDISEIEDKEVKLYGTVEDFKYWYLTFVARGVAPFSAMQTARQRSKPLALL